MQGFTSILLAALLFAAAPAVAQREAPKARAGAIDLSDWDFARDGIVDLAGEWRISWGRFEEPSATGTDAAPIPVPGPWNDLEAPGKPAGGFGHATYRLTVACTTRARLALVLPIEHSAMRVYVNGRLVAVQGTPGGSPVLAQPAFVQQIVPLESVSCPLQLTAHVSNHDMRRGGLLRSIELGSERRVQERRERGLARDLATMGALSVLTLLALLFFFSRREDRTPLWFGLYGLSSVFFAGFGGERILQPLLVPLGWDNVWRLVFVASAAGLGSFLAFIRALYPAAMPRLALRLALLPLALLGLLALATPARFFTQATPLLLGLFAAIGIGSVVTLLRAALQGRRDAWWMLVGVVALFGTGAHDTIEISSQVSNKLVPYGLFVFVLVPAILLARRFARALRLEELRSVEQQQRVDLLVNATKAGVLDGDMIAKTTVYSERLKEMLGYPVDADTSRWPPFLQLTHPEDHGRIQESFFAQMGDLSVKSGVRRWTDSPDFRVRNAAGGYIWVKGEAISVTGEDGRTLRQICSFIDITERKRLELEYADRIRYTHDLLTKLRLGEEALRKGDQRYDIAMRAIDQGVYDWNVAEGTIFYSDGVYRALGMPESMKTPQDWAERIHPEDRAQYDAAIAAHFKGKTERFTSEYRFRGGDGSWRWARQHGLAVRDGQGRVLRMVGSTGDITALKLAEIELSDRSKFIQDLAESVPLALAMRDTEGRYLFVNRRWEEYFGTKREDVIGKSIRERASERMANAVLALDRKVLERGAGAMLQDDDFDYRGRKYSQTRSVMADQQGRVLGVLIASIDTSERAAIELRLREQMALTQAIVSQTPNAIFAKDIEGRFTMVNRGWSEMSRIPVEQALGRSVYDLYPPAAAKRFAEEDEKLIAQGTGAPLMEALHRGPNPDQYRIVRKAVLSRGDEVIGLVCSSTDVSEIKRMERDLESEQRRLDLVVRAQQVGIVDWDGITHATFYSPRFRQILGHAPDADTSAWPDYFKVLIHADDRERVTTRWRAFVLGKSDEGRGNYYSPEEYRLLRADGSHVWVEVAGVAVRDEKGLVLRWIAAVTDVTERREQREALARQRERLALLLRATKAGFMDWDAASDTRSYSERFKEMLGYAPDADTAAWPSLFDMMHPDDREQQREAFREMLRKGAATGERLHGPLEYRLRKADGSYLWVRGEGVAQIAEDGRTERFLTSYIDITHLREMNLALEESVRLREEVDRIGRHDLKTPLNSIIGVPRLLRDSGRLSAEDAELLAFVEQAGYRLLHMVNLSLDMFQMERGNYPFTPKAVDLNEVLAKVARDVGAHARSKRVAISIEGPALHAQAEELLCYSMFANLVKNAVEASDEGGAVSVRLSADASKVQVAIHNLGTVPQAVRARFFDKYSTSGKQGGSGLGTYSARLMARTQQGEIEMETSETDGTTLRVRLVQASAPSREAELENKEQEQVPLGPQRELAVLIVDDDEYTRIFVQRSLPASLRTATAVNGREALEAVQNEPPDVIVMDLDMPVMGGIEAAALIREWEAGEEGKPGRARLAMIAMSSNDGADFVRRSQQAGFDRYLTKPVSPDAIWRAISELTRNQAPGSGEPVRVKENLRAALPGFLASRRALAAELTQTLAQGKAGKARALAHKLAGSLALYGFQWAAAQGKMIERRAGANDLGGLAEDAAALRRHLDEVRVECGEQVFSETTP